MKKILAAALLAASLGTVLTAIPAAAPASAQTVVVGPNGVRIHPGQPEYERYRQGPPHRRDVDRRDAVEIARRNGVDRVRGVEQRRGAWIVTGEGRRGPGLLRVSVDARSGRVLNVERIRRF